MPLPGGDAKLAIARTRLSLAGAAWAQGRAQGASLGGLGVRRAVVALLATTSAGGSWLLHLALLGQWVGSVGVEDERDAAAAAVGRHVVLALLGWGC
jgi:hypothetical protein